jgi:hypothetical protein
VVVLVAVVLVAVVLLAVVLLAVVLLAVTKVPLLVVPPVAVAAVVFAAPPAPVVLLSVACSTLFAQDAPIVTPRPRPTTAWNNLVRDPSMGAV